MRGQDRQIASARRQAGQRVDLQEAGLARGVAAQVDARRVPAVEGAVGGEGDSARLPRQRLAVEQRYSTRS